MIHGHRKGERFCAFRLLWWIAAFGLIHPALAAAEPVTPAVAPPPPEMINERAADRVRPPEQVNPIEGDPDLEPQVTIIERGDEMHEEVRVNGVIRYIRVTSKVGTVYYLVPVNGVAGTYVRRDSLDSGLRVPMWQIFSW
ncbi:MAG: DUF2782 domain-containing protein [Burkholderiales bacterium]|nr:DUF2782 domain-containing protein [Burkholderiales bacterium]